MSTKEPRRRTRKALAGPTGEDLKVVKVGFVQKGRGQLENLQPIHAEDVPPGVIVVQRKGIKSYIADWALHKAEGKSNQEIADLLGINYSTLRTYLCRAHKEGWLRIEDPLDRLEHVIGPKVVENVEHFIDKKSERMTIKAAEGLGYFKSHQVVKSDEIARPTILALKIEMPIQAEQSVEQLMGAIKGTPKYLEGELSAVHEGQPKQV